MKNKKCIIIHGCPSNKEKSLDPLVRTYDKHWIPWTKEELQKKDIKTETPLMPNPWEPIYDDFKKEFEKCDITEETVLVGHSCGCAFLVNWLGETKKKVAKLILVAPWKIEDKGRELFKDFYNYPIDETIKDRVEEVIMFIADDEANNGKKSLMMFHDSLGGEIIELKSHGHFTLKGMGTEEFPELIEAIKN